MGAARNLYPGHTIRSVGNARVACFESIHTKRIPCHLHRLARDVQIAAPETDGQG